MRQPKNAGNCIKKYQNKLDHFRIRQTENEICWIVSKCNVRRQWRDKPQKFRCNYIMLK